MIKGWHRVQHKPNTSIHRVQHTLSTAYTLYCIILRSTVTRFQSVSHLLGDHDAPKSLYSHIYELLLFILTVCTLNRVWQDTIAATKCTTTWSHLPLGDRSEICLCLHLLALQPIAFPTAFHWGFCMCLHRLQWWKSHNSMLNQWIQSQHPSCLPPKLPPPHWPPASTALFSLNHGLRVNLQTLLITPSTFAHSWPPGAYLQTHSIAASKSISKLARSQLPSVSPNFLHNGLQVRTIMGDNCISKLAARA